MTLKLDIGCGPRPTDGFVGLDIIPFPDSPAIVCDLRQTHWLFGRNPLVPDDLVETYGDGLVRLKDDTVDEAKAFHFIEHLTNFGDKWERVKFLNELYRVLKPGGKCVLLFPHWCSNRYYGDPTHKEAMSEMFFYYLKKEWRMSQAPHTDSQFNPDGYACDFDATWGNHMHPAIIPKSAEAQQFSMQFYKEAITDLQAVLTKPVPKK